MTPLQWISGGAAVSLTTASADLADDVRWEQQYCKQLEDHYHILTPDEVAAARRREIEEVRPFFPFSFTLISIFLVFEALSSARSQSVLPPLNLRMQCQTFRFKGN